MQPTSYSITSLSDRHGTGSSTGAADIVVNLVDPPTIVEASVVVLGQPLRIRAADGYDSYQWFHNGSAIEGANAAILDIATVTEADLGAYAVIGTRGGCVSGLSPAYTLTLFAAPSVDAIIPMLELSKGVEGATFHSRIHIANANEDSASGVIEFALGDESHSYDYALKPGETRYLHQLVPASFKGLMTATVRRVTGPLPTLVAHVASNRGVKGETGLLQHAIGSDAFLSAGDRAALIVPADAPAGRYNIGLRAVDALKVSVTRRNAEGRVLDSAERSVAENSLVQEPIEKLLNFAVRAGDSLTFEILEGRGVIYGFSSTHSGDDPNLDLATTLTVRNRSGRYLLPFAGSMDSKGDRYATSVQIYNASAEALVATLSFRTAGVPAATSDKFDVRVDPYATVSYRDIAKELGVEGAGSLDMTTTSRVRPVLVARMHARGKDVPLSLTMNVMDEETALGKGEEGVIVAPHSKLDSGFNIGLRTLGSGVKLTATVRRSNGDVVKTAKLEFQPDFTTQVAANELLGVTLEGDESIVFKVEQGSAIIYGMWTDAVTNDPAMQNAVRP